MRPRKGLFLVLAVLFGLWMAGLLGLYFLTVYPQHHRAVPPGSTQPQRGMAQTPGAALSIVVQPAW